MMRAFTILICSVALMGGCVMKSKYEALEKRLAKLRRDKDGELAEKQSKIKALGEAVQQREAQIKTLDQQIAGLKTRIAQLKQEGERSQATIRQLEGQLANVVKDRARLKTSAKQLKAALAEVSRRKAEADRRVAQYRHLLARFKKLIDAGKLKVKIADGRMVLELATDVLFSSGSAKLSEDGKIAITEVTNILVSLPKRRFQVEGHTDNVPIKTARFPSNWALAAARALVVVSTMIEGGMGGERISAASFGEFRPVMSNDTPEGRMGNRRIEIVVVPDLSTLPGFTELQKAVGR